MYVYGGLGITVLNINKQRTPILTENIIYLPHYDKTINKHKLRIGTRYTERINRLLNWARKIRI